MRGFASIVFSSLLAGCASQPDNAARLDEQEINRRVEASIIKRQEADDVARTPGFETTTKSGREVMKIAMDYAKTGNDLGQYRAPTITLLKREGRMKWLVSWELKGMPTPGGFISVLIDDDTGEIQPIPGM